MKKFVVFYPFECTHKKIPDNLFPIDCDPSGPELYIFSKEKTVTFNEVISIIFKTHRKNDYLAAISLIYFKYYNEFYDFLKHCAKDQILSKKYKRVIMRFYKNHLRRWIEFVKCSDDTLFPQNFVFRKMHELIQNTYSKH